ncbi:MAG TPA: hypothetical protein VF299_05510 [Mycobacterium sp.]
MNPDTSSFSPLQDEGFPPFYQESTGNESWSIFDLNTDKVLFADGLSGVDTHTAVGTFSNDDFLINNGFVSIEGAPVAPGSEIDIANFGGGFENEFVDIVGNGTGAGMSDLLITPFEDFTLLGTFPF